MTPFPLADADDATGPDLFALTRLTKDLREAAARLSPNQARFVVDTYYQLQQVRLAAADQVRAATAAQEPAEFVEWLSRLLAKLERTLAGVMDTYTDASVVGRWAKSIVGIGPVLAGGLLAHIDIHKATTAGDIWRFAGLDPTLRWAKGEKRPWNASLKVLTWKIGESFVKTQHHAAAVYGPIYRERKALEIERNTAGLFADQAARALTERKFRRDTVAKRAYEAGRLPDAHVHARARRYAVKLFLAHYHHVAYESTYNAPPPKPYILTKPEHTHYLAPPNWPLPGEGARPEAE